MSVLALGAVVGLFTLHPFAAVGVLSVVVVSLLVNRAVWDSTTVLTIYLVLLVLVPARWVVYSTGALGTPANIVALSAAGWWLLARGRNLDRADRKAYFLWVAALAMFLVAILTYSMGFSRHVSAAEASNGLRGIIKLVGLLGITLVATDGPFGNERVVKLLDRFVTVSAALALVGIAQYFLPVDPVSWIRLPGFELNGEVVSVRSRSSLARVAGTTLHPIEFSAVIAAASPLALHFWMFPTDTRRGWAALRLGLVAVALPLSISRTGFLMIFVVAAAMWTAWSWRRRLNLLIVSVVFAGLFRSAVPGVLGTLKSLVLNASSDPSVQGRTNDFRILSEYISERPFFGRGYDTFIPIEYFFVDNQILLIVVSSGFVGLATHLAFVGAGIMSARQVYWHGDSPSSRHLGAALAASIIAIFAGFVTFDTLSFPTIGGVYFLLIGCAAALWRHDVGDRGRKYTNERALVNRWRLVDVAAR